MYEIYLDVEIRDNTLTSSIVAGFAAAAAHIPGSTGKQVMRGVGVALSRRLTASGRAVGQMIGPQLVANLQELLSRPGQGATYTTEWRSRPDGTPYPLIKVPLNAPHTASAPGDPPAQLSGALARSISYQLFRGPRGVIIRVGTPLMYGLFMELGGAHFEPRPWLRVLANSLKGRQRVRGVGNNYSVVVARTLSGIMKRGAASLFRN